MAIPKYDEVRLPLLRLISDGSPYTQKMCVEHLQDYFELTEEERNETLSGGRTVLIDGQQLAQYMIEVGIGASVEKVYGSEEAGFRLLY